jgi:DNA-binding transcriptional MerR regulator
MNDEFFAIGELSKRSGVPVKTIRHYADEGVLAPSSTSDAGYRLYTSDDARKLGIVRSLRALGFSLDAIKAMLDGSREPSDMAELQLDVIETQIRALGRQRTILRAAKELHARADIVRHLDAAYAAASLGAAERSHRLERWLENATTVDPGAAGRAKIRSMILDGLPDELSPEQLEAWIALSALLDDEGLLETLRLQHGPFADAPVDDAAREAFGREIMTIQSETIALLDASPDDERVQTLLDRQMTLFAKALELQDDPQFPEWFLAYAERTNDPRIERFWNEAAILRGWPPMPPFTRANALLLQALRVRLAGAR